MTNKRISESKAMKENSFNGHFPRKIEKSQFSKKISGKSDFLSKS